MAKKVPKIDFEKELILVETFACFKHTLDIISDGGNVKLDPDIQSLEDSPRFYYMIVSIPREGVKTVNRKKVNKSWSWLWPW